MRYRWAVVAAAVAMLAGAARGLAAQDAAGGSSGNAAATDPADMPRIIEDATAGTG